MRKLLLILVIVLFVIGNIFSQTKPMVFVKWAPATLATGKVTLGSELSFTKKSSVNFMIGIPAAVKSSFEYDGEESDITAKAFSVLLGYRYYTGKRQARGFYVEPYAKYLRHEANGILEGQLEGKAAEMDTRTVYKGLGLGAQLGVQFMLFQRVSIDFYFLGFEANTAKFKATSTDVANNLPWTFVQASEAEQELRDIIDEVPFFEDKVDISVDQVRKTVAADFKGFVPGLRFGASIGFRF